MNQKFFKKIILATTVIFGSNCLADSDAYAMAKTHTRRSVVNYSAVVPKAHAHGMLTQAEIDQITETCTKAKTELNASIQAEITKKLESFDFIFDAFAKNTAPAQSTILPEYTSSDLKLLSGGQNEGLVSVLNTLFGPDKTLTMSGKAFAAHELISPSTEIRKIEQRQALIKWLLDNPEKKIQLELLLKQIAELEKSWTEKAEDTTNEILKFFLPKSNETLGNLLNSVVVPVYAIMGEYQVNHSARNLDLNTLKSCINGKQAFLFPTDFCLKLIAFIGQKFETLQNKSDRIKTFLIFSNHLNLISTIITAAVNLSDSAKYFGQGYFLKEATLGASIAQIMIGIYGLYKAKKESNFDKLFVHQERLCNIQKLVSIFAQLSDALPKNICAEQIANLQDFLQGKASPAMQDLLQNLNSNTFKSSASLVSHHGRTLGTFKKFSAERENFASSMQFIGMLDACLAAANLVQNSGYCFAEFVEADKAMIECTGMRNIFVAGDKVVANDAIVGKDSSAKNCGFVISGPNYAGKSTYLNGIVTAALLAQAFGIAPAAKLKMTPFHKFEVYTTVMDSTASEESRFSAEMQRIKDLISAIDKSKAEDKKILVLIDEPLTGTNEKAAESLVRPLLKKMVTYDHGIFVVATHLKNVIANTPQDTNNLLAQIHPEAILDEKGLFKAATYQIKPGPSYVSSALNVAQSKLAGAGMDDLLKEAQSIYLQR